MNGVEMEMVMDPGAVTTPESITGRVVVERTMVWVVVTEMMIGGADMVTGGAVVVV